MSKAPTPDLATLLRHYHKHNLSRAINIFFTPGGDVQVSVERGRTMAFYGEVGSDPADTLTKALLPDYLKGGFLKDDTPAPTVEDDDDDDMSVI